MGRKLWGLFKESGRFQGGMETYTLVETEYSPRNYGYDRLHDLSSRVREGEIPRAEYDLILNEMDSLQRQGRFFYSLTSHIYIGTKV
jgi:hypothetical protein